LLEDVAEEVDRDVLGSGDLFALDGLTARGGDFDQARTA
jgi:hypothetical protein